MGKHQIFTVDAFATAPFTGNPAAVMPLSQRLPDDVMQKIASEMNLSETAFLEPLEGHLAPECWSSGRRFGLRWMSPTNEVKLCGHATLASAHVLFFHFGMFGENKSAVLEFETLSGILKAQRTDGREVVLDLPALPPSPLDSHGKEVCLPLVEALLGSMAIEEVLLSREAQKLMVCLNNSYSRIDLESIKVDAEALLKIHNGSMVKGIIVTLQGDRAEGTSLRGLEPYHFASRYFTPWNGIPEDPVTGSAHSVLGPYWAKKLNIYKLKCHQSSVRGGDLSLTIRDDNRVEVGGRGTPVIEGYINI